MPILQKVRKSALAQGAYVPRPLPLSRRARRGGWGVKAYRRDANRSPALPGELLQLRLLSRDVRLEQRHQRLLDRTDAVLDRDAAQLHFAAVLGDDLRHLRPLWEARPENRITVVVPRLHDRPEVGVLLLELWILVGACAAGHAPQLDEFPGLRLRSQPLNEEPGSRLLLLRALRIDAQREAAKRWLVSSRPFRLDLHADAVGNGGRLGSASVS